MLLITSKESQRVTCANKMEEKKAMPVASTLWRPKPETAQDVSQSRTSPESDPYIQIHPNAKQNVGCIDRFDQKKSFYMIKKNYDYF